MNIRLETAAVFGLILAEGGGVASAQTVAHLPHLGTVLEYSTTGCDGAVVITPLPGKQFVTPDPSTGEYTQNKAPKSFYALAAAHHVHWATTMTCTSSHARHALGPAGWHAGSRSRLGTPSTFYSANWSGYQISNTAQYVQAGWTQPTVTSAFAATPQYQHIPPFPPHPAPTIEVSIWTGIGGGAETEGNRPLIQSGTRQKVGDAPYFWWEVFPGPEHKITSKALHPGDFVGSASIWTPDSPDASSGTTTMGICNFSRGGCVNFVMHHVEKPGNSTEWIVEAPRGPGGQSVLADFGMVHFTNAVWAGSNTPPGSNAHSIADGTNLTKIVLKQYLFCGGPGPCRGAEPGALDSNGQGFTVTFHHY